MTGSPQRYLGTPACAIRSEAAGNRRSFASSERRGGLRLFEVENGTQHGTHPRRILQPTRLFGEPLKPRPRPWTADPERVLPFTGRYRVEDGDGGELVVRTTVGDGLAVEPQRTGPVRAGRSVPRSPPSGPRRHGAARRAAHFQLIPIQIPKPSRPERTVRISSAPGHPSPHGGRAASAAWGFG